MINLPPEKLGSFFLGAEYDSENNKITDQTVNYDARDLTTHAVCVGMTGSGKTGLCIGLLEEAALDKVPAIIIDPKGDMTNLMLQFEDLDPNDFKDWINVDDASRKGMSVDDYAAATAKKWKDGLASWGQSTDRIKSLKNSVEYTIYTPGSNAGMPINIMGSFSAPSGDFDADAEMLLERIQGTVAALLGMIGSKEDPQRSREGILLSNLFEYHWRRGEDLDLTKLIMGIQSPPMDRLGVFELDTFYPQKDRFNLAMDFNSLIASPSFKYWLEGDPLDIDKIYFTKEGKPRHSIFYIAHLSDSERMFFVTLLLNSLISWMRRQSGTTSLRSLLYFDEIFGYFPPTANPPSKKPLLTLLKQARAFGVGSVLVTQNPVDIDYKGLSNAGTWFIGKLQTDRDKARVLQGLEGAIAEAGGAAKLDFDKIITGLDSRVFLMHNVHEDAPVVYHTRWAMSYLRGPLTRPQVKSLMADKKASKGTVLKTGSVVDFDIPVTTVEKKSEVAPTLDPAIEQRYFDPSYSQIQDANKVIYIPKILVISKVRFYDEKRKVDKVEEFNYLVDAPDDFGRINWDDGHIINGWESYIVQNPKHDSNSVVSFSEIPEAMNTTKEFKTVEKNYSDFLYHNKKTYILEHDDFDIYQKENESDEAFNMRVQTMAREQRDEELDELRDKYEDKFERIDDKIRKEERDLEEAEAEVKSRKTEEYVNIAETIFSVFSKRRSRSFSTAASKRNMSRRAKEKVEESLEEIEELEVDYKDLKLELKDKLAEITKEWEAKAQSVTKKEVKPRRTDVRVEKAVFVWYPT